MIAVPAAAYIGRPAAPAFKGKALTGEPFSSESLKSKPVLIQFWATWCGFCRRDQPAVDQIVKENPELVVLAVSVNESRNKVEKYLADSPRSPKIVLTEDTNLAALFPVTGFPTYILIDAKGGIVDKQEGAGGYDALQQLIAKL